VGDAGRGSWKRSDRDQSYPRDPWRDTGAAPDPIHELSARAAAARPILEEELVSAVLADPDRASCARGVDLARRHRVDLSLIADDSLRLILACAFAWAAEPLPVVLRRAVAVLRFCGLPMDAAAVVDLAERHPGPSIVPSLAFRLIDLSRRLSDAADHIRYARKLLEAVA
jgi:hypothetical protein